MTERRDKQLDETLATGRRSSDPEIDALADQAQHVREELSVLAPEARHQRALFVQGVAGRSRPLSAFRFLAPAAIVVAALVALAGFGRTALPGQTLWPVREVLSTVGLAATPEEEIDRRIDDALAQCREAADLEISNPMQARHLVWGAIADLQRARALSRDLDPDQRSTYLFAIDEIEDWAAEMITEITERTEADAEPAQEDDDGSGPRDDEGPSDDSGPSSGAQGGDTSGPGGGDNSGSGSEDSGGDNSGSGSDDSGSGNSGSGSDDSGSGNSGSGSDDSGGDSSGSGDDD